MTRIQEGDVWKNSRDEIYRSTDNWMLDTELYTAKKLSQKNSWYELKMTINLINSSIISSIAAIDFSKSLKSAIYLTTGQLSDFNRFFSINEFSKIYLDNLGIWNQLDKEKYIAYTSIDVYLKEKKSIDFEKVLKTAQKLGYAEKDPTFDVEGIDAAHKLAILSLLVFKKLPRLSGMNVRGVSEVTLYDIKTARDFGYKIKLLAICSNENSFECSVEPWLISKDHSLAKIDGVLNAIEINSNLAGPLLLTGAGAGSKPTASAVMSDVCLLYTSDAADE